MISASGPDSTTRLRAAPPAYHGRYGVAAVTTSNAPAPDRLGHEPARRPTGAFAGLAPLSSPAYRYLFVGTALTLGGYFMQVVAQGWLVYELTGSPSWLGIVSFAGGIPLLVLALPAGVVVDRFDRRAVLMVGQGLSALVVIVLAGLIAAGLVLPWHVALA